jgi:hypothetical protein
MGKGFGMTTELVIDGEFAADKWEVVQLLEMGEVFSWILDMLVRLYLMSS